MDQKIETSVNFYAFNIQNYYFYNSSASIKVVGYTYVSVLTKALQRYLI